MEMELASTLAQFGAAGLIGWMWLAERRAHAADDRMLRESHERLMQERVLVRELVKVVRANTRALAALEAGQRHLLVMFARRSGGSVEEGERRGSAA